jgi:hypothetical protein
MKEGRERGGGGDSDLESPQGKAGSEQPKRSV